MFETGLEIGQKLTNRQLMNIFHCACEGGIRYSSRTNTLVLIINNTKTGLPNLWDKGILYFAGRPLKNPGILNGANKRLAQFLNTNGDIFLFEVNEPGIYAYKGELSSAGTYIMKENSSLQAYPVFPLKLKHNHP